MNFLINANSKKDEGESPDRTGLFDLPEEILHHIVSFLSLQGEYESSFFYIIIIIIRVVPDTELAWYPAFNFAGTTLTG